VEREREESSTFRYNTGEHLNYVDGGLSFEGKSEGIQYL
jgi:hypothetical protein